MARPNRHGISAVAAPLRLRNVRPLAGRTGRSHAGSACFAKRCDNTPRSAASQELPRSLTLPCPVLTVYALSVTGLPAVFSRQERARMNAPATTVLAVFTAVAPVFAQDPRPARAEPSSQPTPEPRDLVVVTPCRGCVTSVMNSPAA